MNITLLQACYAIQRIAKQRGGIIYQIIQDISVIATLIFSSSESSFAIPSLDKLFTITLFLSYDPNNNKKKEIFSGAIIYAYYRKKETQKINLELFTSRVEAGKAFTCPSKTVTNYLDSRAYGCVAKRKLCETKEALILFSSSVLRDSDLKLGLSKK